MKMFHLSDLHIGKQLHHYNLKTDQEHILKEIIQYAKAETPDVIVIAGDIYDKSIPSAEAVTVFDAFLTGLSTALPSAAIMMIAGNHDSSERLEFASGLLENHRIYIEGIPPRTKDEYIKKVTIEDSYGPVHFYLLPFLKPGYVRQIFDEPVESYSEAVQKLVERESIDEQARNVLISHQFYTGAGNTTLTSDSEMVRVGGLDNVDTGCLQPFDYVALGHIHTPQSIGREQIRYCGSPLKYSVSERAQEKSVTVVELYEREHPVVLRTLPLHPLREIIKKTGRLQEILTEAKTEEREAYISIVLTDEVIPANPKEQLQAVFSNVLEIQVDNAQTRKIEEGYTEEIKLEDPLTTFQGFFREMQGRDLSEAEYQILLEVVEADREGDEI
ncbi:MAG: exonuclease SbcCD subunit D [Lachnospiraceae bacterium]